jgi:hypothetical protein
LNHALIFIPTFIVGRASLPGRSSGRDARFTQEDMMSNINTIAPAKVGGIKRLTDHMAIAEFILRHRERFFMEIKEGVDLQAKINSMIVASAVFLFLFGAVLGSSSGVAGIAQALSTAVKLPILFLLTSIICLPTLYLFNTLFGARQGIRQNLAMYLAPVTIMTVMLFGFAPIVLFFLITVSDYQFFKLLNVAIFAICGAIGMWFLLKGMWIITEGDEEGAQLRRLTLFFWMFLYAFVGSQMAWTLRPFIGDPNYPFELLRQTGGNFYANVWYSLAEFLGFLVVR